METCLRKQPGQVTRTERGLVKSNQGLSHGVPLRGGDCTTSRSLEGVFLVGLSAPETHYPPIAVEPGVGAGHSDHSGELVRESPVSEPLRSTVSK